MAGNKAAKTKTIPVDPPPPVTLPSNDTDKAPATQAEPIQLTEQVNVPKAEVPADTSSKITLTPPSDKAGEAQSPSDLKTKAVFGAVLTILVALVFAAGVYFSNYINKPNEPISTSAIVEELPKANLTIDAPKEDEAFTVPQIEVRGKTVPNSLVSVYTDTYEDVFESDESGNFSGLITLEEGPNEITFVAFGDDVSETEETRSVAFVREEEL